MNQGKEGDDSVREKYKCSVFVSHCESTSTSRRLTCLYLGIYWEINKTFANIYNSIQSFADGDIV